MYRQPSEQWHRHYRRISLARRYNYPRPILYYGAECQGNYIDIFRYARICVPYREKLETQEWHKPISTTVDAQHPPWSDLQHGAWRNDKCRRTWHHTAHRPRMGRSMDSRRQLLYTSLHGLYAAWGFKNITYEKSVANRTHHSRHRKRWRMACQLRSHDMGYGGIRTVQSYRRPPVAWIYLSGN